MARVDNSPPGRRVHMQRDYGYYREALRDRRLPLAFCDLDLFDANARELARRAAGKPLRVASKSLRCTTLLHRLLERPEYRGVMCFAAAEAAMLASGGLSDLLVAYPTVEPADVAAACRALAERDGVDITLMVDDPAQLPPLDRAARAHGIVLPVCLDLDMSSRYPGLWFGVRRSPIRDVAAALALAQAVRDHASLSLVGVMGYEAQIAGLPDAVPGQMLMSLTSRALKRTSFREVSARRRRVVDALRRDGFELRFVNGGGTGSLERTSRDPAVTEVTAGSGLYSPTLFDDFRAFRHQPAAGFALPVTRRPGPNLFTCHGGGYVASGPPGPDRLPRPFMPAGAELLPHEGAGEVQTPVRYDGPVQLRIGDPVFFRHAKAGELCERFNTLLLISGGRVVDEAPTYRGEGEAFL